MNVSQYKMYDLNIIIVRLEFFKSFHIKKSDAKISIR